MLKIAIVMELCPAAFVTRRMKTLQSLRYVLESRDIVSVTQVPEGYLCTYDNGARPPVVFEKEPTVEYHCELYDAPRDWSNHVSVVEDALRRMLHACKGTNPHRTIASSPPFKCKCCGHDNYIDCGTHYTCTKCAVVSTKVHQGLAYREMRERALSEHEWSSQRSSVLVRVQSRDYLGRQVHQARLSGQSEACSQDRVRRSVQFAASEPRCCPQGSGTLLYHYAQRVTSP